MSDRETSRPIEILLVEDNPGDVRLTLEAFKEGKIYNKLRVARDGAEALDMLYQRAPYEDSMVPDLILLDLNLPKKSGREVLAQIKTDPHLKRIPVVVLTTSTAEQDVLASYNLFANSYIVKPVDLEQFFSVIKSIEQFWLTVVKLPGPIDDEQNPG
jgi:chemotaxis family two-component system response regulator Rcp1